jgi:hypothetical protein
MGVHCIAHRENLAVQSLFDLISLQGLNHSWLSFMIILTIHPKSTWSFRGWFKLWKPPGNKILKTIKAAKWMSMFEPLKRIMVEYQTRFIHVQFGFKITFFLLWENLEVKFYNVLEGSHGITLGMSNMPSLKNMSFCIPLRTLFSLHC